MRVLALITDGFGGHGGIARYNGDLMRALARSAVVDELIALPRFAGAAADRPREVEQLPPSPGAVAWSVRAAMLALRRRPDMIFCGHLNAAPLGAALARLLARPLWLQLHGIEAWSRRSRLIRRAVEAVTLATSVSRYTRDRFLGWANVEPQRVRVLPNTVAERFGPRAPRADLRTRYGIEGRKVILTVGRLASSERYKGHDSIIRCLPEIRRRVPEVRYLVVGAGDDRSRLAQLAAEQGVGDLVTFAGAVLEAELPDHYALADVFAMPSRGEGFGIAFLEAAACGVPVIGTREGGSWDALREGHLGTAVEAGNAPALSEALIAALTGAASGNAGAVDVFRRASFEAHVDTLVRHLAHSTGVAACSRRKGCAR
jgi:phosphatidylinositol alpha-1,6-mannosyltransferase